jgi:hypothetical protein
LVVVGVAIIRVVVLGASKTAATEAIRAAVAIVAVFKATVEFITAVRAGMVNFMVNATPAVETIIMTFVVITDSEATTVTTEMPTSTPTPPSIYEQPLPP